jgi:hypothetical protein
MLQLTKLQHKFTNSSICASKFIFYYPDLSVQLLRHCRHIQTLWKWELTLYTTDIWEETLGGIMAFSGTLCRLALVRTGVSEELSTSFIRVPRIGELGTTNTKL